MCVYVVKMASGWKGDPWISSIIKIIAYMCTYVLVDFLECSTSLNVIRADDMYMLRV